MILDPIDDVRFGSFALRERIQNLINDLLVRHLGYRVSTRVAFILIEVAFGVVKAFAAALLQGLAHILIQLIKLIDNSLLAVKDRR